MHTSNIMVSSVVFHMCPLLEHMAQMLALGFEWGVEKPYYRRKTLLDIGET